MEELIKSVEVLELEKIVSILKVKLRFYGYVALKTGSAVELTFDHEPTLRETIELVNARFRLMPPIQTLRASPVRLLVNGSEADPEARLRDGDEVKVLPFIAGG